MQYTHLLPINTRLIYDSVVTGTFGNANTLAGFLAAGLPFLFESFSKKPKSIFLLFLLLLILNLLTLLLTKSRGSWIGLLIGTSLFFYSPIKKWLKNQYIRKMQIIITLVTLVSIIALFLFLFFINKPSSTGRLFIWKISILMIRDFPLFGIGYGNYEVRYLNYQASFFQNVANMRYSHYASNIKHAHNEYIHILAETGFLGLMLFLSIIIFFILFVSK
jgi:O-antigen ligase